MTDDRNAQSVTNITGITGGNINNINKRIPRYKIGDDNIIKISNEKQRYYLPDLLITYKGLIKIILDTSECNYTFD